MLDRLQQIGPHEAQIVLTVTLLVATAALALLCDVLRYRWWNSQPAGQAGEIQKPVHRKSIAPMLVPEDALPEAPAPRITKKSSRASRLAAAANKPRRALSLGAQAAISKGAHAAVGDDGASEEKREPVPPPAALPTGFHTRRVLADLSAGRLEVNGFVVTITTAESAPEEFRNTIASLLEPDDFAAPVDDRNFVLVLPRRKGRSAQRRMREVTQRLWELQMRNHGTAFQWSGVEALDEALSVAVEASLERAAGESKTPRPGPQSESGTPEAGTLQRAS